jgi:hypothetical protein
MRKLNRALFSWLASSALGKSFALPTFRRKALARIVSSESEFVVRILDDQEEVHRPPRKPSRTATGGFA